MGNTFGLPESVDTATFATALEVVAEFVLKNKAYRDRLMQTNPLLLDKTMLAQEMATHVLRALMQGPSAHLVVLEEARGADRWNASGTYRFTEPIPVKDVADAFQAVGVVMGGTAINAPMKKSHLKRIK